ncbi:MAG TPA: hypothetical protein VJQ47_19330 [Steroidobacteraceae bacterium]|nr:hypothetical protein [Steroidobacteraceae bacterium]
MKATPGERRPAIWPWLLMPLVTLVVFYVLNRLRQTAEPAPLAAGPAAAAPQGNTASVPPGEPAAP